MSAYDFGAHHESDQVVALKQQLSNKANQYATLQSQLLKRNAEYDDLRTQLSETVNKLRLEADRALGLDSQRQSCSADLQNEKIQRQNVELTLTAVQDQLAEQKRSSEALEVAVRTLSDERDVAKQQCARLGVEKGKLELRAKELEANVNQLASGSTSSTGRTRSQSRARPSISVTTLEQQLSDLRDVVAQRDAQLQQAQEYTRRVQEDLTRAENEKIALEKGEEGRIRALEAALEERDEELALVREQAGNISGFRDREEELLERIEDEERRNALLDEMVEGLRRELNAKPKANVKALEEQLRNAERKLHAETKKSAEADARSAAEIEQREVLQKEFERANDEVQRLVQENRLLSARTQHSSTVNSSLNETLSHPNPSSSVPPVIDDATAAELQRLMLAVERLRSERDGTRRDLEFVEMESKFRIQALEAQLSGTTAASTPSTQSLNSSTTAMHRPSQAAIVALSIVTQRLEVDLASEHQYLQAAEEKAWRTEQELVAAQVQCDSLQLQITHCNDALSQLREEAEESDLKLVRTESQLSDALRSLEDAESQRADLCLQCANLETDLETIKEELIAADRRSSNQLALISSADAHDATKALKERIVELEARVLRRTEQIGAHQHDIERLEMNLRVQEERVADLQCELDTATRNVEAMVEDCAEAREARDGAVQRAEELELDMETMEARVQMTDEERQAEVETVIGLWARAISRTRDIARAAKHAASASERGSSSMALRLSVTQTESTNAMAELRREFDRRTDDLQDQLRDARVSEQEMSKDTLQVTVALALVVQQAQQARSLARVRLSNLQEHVQDLETVRESLQIRAAGYDELQHTHKQAQDRLETMQTAHNTSMAVVEQRLSTAMAELEASKAAHREDAVRREEQQATLIKAKEELVVRLAELAEQSDRSTRVEQDIEELERAHATAMEDNQRRLDLAIRDLESSTVAREEAERRLEDALSEVRRLQDENDDTTDQLSAAKTAHSELEQLRSDHGHELARLQKLYEATVHDVEDARAALEETQALNAQAAEERALELQSMTDLYQQSQLSQEDLTQQIEAAHSEISRNEVECQRLQEELDTVRQQLADKVAESVAVASVRDALEVKVQEEEREVHILRSELRRLLLDLSRAEEASKGLEDQLEEQRAQHERVVATLQAELASMQAKVAAATTGPQNMVVPEDVKEQIQELEDMLREKCQEVAENDEKWIEILDEKKKLLRQVDTLSGKVQSLQNKLTKTKEAVASAKAQLASAQELASHTPAPISSPKHLPSSGLVGSEHSRAASSRMLPESTMAAAPSPARVSLASAPSARQRTPTAPASSHPFTSNAADFPHSPANRVVPRSRSPTSFAIPQPPPIPNVLDSPSRTRTLSGPSSIPRPKTPDARASATFRVKTPELRQPPALPTHNLSQHEPLTSKKRPAPDEFDGCDPVPAQPFTADCTPTLTEGNNARTRKQESRNGFTPVRGVHTRTISLPVHQSPQRLPVAPSHRTASAAPTPSISDVTNSPGSRAMFHVGPPTAEVQPVKKGWLNKVRGTAPPRTASGRPIVFSRQGNA